LLILEDLVDLLSRPSKNLVIDISADNVTVRNGTISGFHSGVSLTGSQGKAQDLKLLGNAANGVLLFSGNDNAVVNCFIIGSGNGVPGVFGILVRTASGDLVKDNQISETSGGIDSTSDTGCAFIHNYVANSFKGLVLSTSD
jgi:parallel beta-helix repeat protein